ncbi:uncharacterized protein V6R79_016595 [Siganus canaliculatus]
MRLPGCLVAWSSSTCHFLPDSAVPSGLVSWLPELTCFCPALLDPEPLGGELLDPGWLVPSDHVLLLERLSGWMVVLAVVVPLLCAVSLPGCGSPSPPACLYATDDFYIESDDDSEIADTTLSSPDRGDSEITDGSDFRAVMGCLRVINAYLSILGKRTGARIIDCYTMTELWQGSQKPYRRTMMWQQEQSVNRDIGHSL